MNPTDTPLPDNQPPAPGLPATIPQLTPLTAVIPDDGNFPAALGAGLVAAIVGAAVWAAVTVGTGYQIGWVAIGVGFLVGYAIRAAGRGRTQRFAIAGAGFALLGCVLGNLLTVVGVVSQQEHLGFFSILARLTPSVAFEFLKISFQPMDLLFYAIAVYEGFKVSVVRTAA